MKLGRALSKQKYLKPLKIVPKSKRVNICTGNLLQYTRKRKREDMYTRSVSSFFVAISGSQIPICCQRAAHGATSGPCSQLKWLPGRDGVTAFLTQFPTPCCFKVKYCMYTGERHQGLLLLGITLAAEALLACGLLESFIANHSFHNCDGLSCEWSSCWPFFQRPQRLECSVTLGILACSPTSCEDLCFWGSWMPSYNYCFCSYQRKQMLCNIIQKFNSSVHKG